MRACSCPALLGDAQRAVHALLKVALGLDERIVDELQAPHLGSRRMRAPACTRPAACRCRLPSGWACSRRMHSVSSVCSHSTVGTRVRAHVRTPIHHAAPAAPPGITPAGPVWAAGGCSRGPGAGGAPRPPDRAAAAPRPAAARRPHNSMAAPPRPKHPRVRIMALHWRMWPVAALAAAAPNYWRNSLRAPMMCCCLLPPAAGAAL